MRAAWTIGPCLTLLLSVGACGDEPPPSDSAGGSSGSSGGEASTGNPPPGATSDGTGTSIGSADGTSTGASTDDGDSSGPPPIHLDLGTIPDAPPPVCGGEGEGELSLSYIWIANSAQGTISKIDTATMVEEGRYQARPSNGDPSRTSVNLVGDVAVANRNGGVTKFWANPDDCVSSNGIPGIQTSTGPGDVLPWGQEDCMAWHTPLACSSNRPAAWTRGVFNEAECTFEDMDFWTACDSNVLLLDGETGVVEETIPIPGGFPFVYGGAADADGNFWGIDTGMGQLLRVDFNTLALEAWPLPPNWGYGITVDSIGRPWVCGGGGVSRFDLVTHTWDSAGGSGIGGCMTDGADLIWHGNDFGLLMGFNINTLAVDEQIQLPEYVHGVSVDFQGNVWGVSFAGSNAYRANPTTGAVDVYGGLIGAYTYSDMTGHALSTVGGGGIPTG
ncbi:MAG: hypothetical protein H6712_34870 [Myxococcales bacterium]|nr:hypothetical protein [Myxococcales bacterium]MCB9719081.1 hypothetical protein [Myxococcales bacterium]